MLLVSGIVFLLNGLLLLLGGRTHSGPVPDANFTTCDKHTPSAGVDSTHLSAPPDRSIRSEGRLYPDRSRSVHARA